MAKSPPPDRTVTVSVSTQVKPDHPPHPEHPPHPDKPPEQPPGEIDNTLPTPPDPIIDPPSTGRSVTITIGDIQHQFLQDEGKDLGTYTSDHITQHCILATCPTLPAFSVMFRPDADGQREEVVFELGAIWAMDALANLPAYTARIYKDGAEVAVVEAPRHNYYGRWR